MGGPPLVATAPRREGLDTRNENGFATASSIGAASANAGAFVRQYYSGFTDRPREIASTLRRVRVNSDRKCFTCAASFGSERKAIFTRKRFNIAVTGRLSECCERKAVICCRIPMRSSESSSCSFVTTNSPIDVKNEAAAPSILARRPRHGEPGRGQFVRCVKLPLRCVTAIKVSN